MLKKVKVLNYAGKTLDVKKMEDSNIDVWESEQHATGIYGAPDEWYIAIEETDNVIDDGIEIRTDDGRLRVRSDSLPLKTTTTFTCQGDDTDIGGGTDAFWDFSTNINDVSAPAGFKRKAINMTFIDPVYVKEGSIYFHDAVKGSYADVKVMCPTGAYYLDRNGVPNIAAVDTPVAWMIRKHFFAGSAPMGDELNTETAQDNAIPVGYALCIEVTVPDTDISSYGWGSIELYRTRTVLLPGEEV